MESGRFFDPRSELTIHRRQLPHWQQPGVWFSVTWRLADSLPETLLAPWREQRRAWLTTHPRPWAAEVEAEYFQRFGGAIEQWLDAGHGSCLLRDPPMRAAVEATLRGGEPRHCALEAFVLMPNHVHVLAALAPGADLARLLKMWKGVSARRINARRGSHGPVWYEEYWDRLIRSEAHFARVVDYLARNPERARLAEGEFTRWRREEGHSGRSQGGPWEDGHSCPSRDRPRAGCWA